MAAPRGQSGNGWAGRLSVDLFAAFGVHAESMPVAVSHIELRLLRYAVAIADDLHFTRASHRLHISTPSLSRQIRQLEGLLGYALFQRRTREVVLTPAGAAFVAEAREAIAHVQRAVESGAVAACKAAGLLCVGYTPLLDTAILPKIRDNYARLAGNAKLHFESAYSTAQVALILNGRLQAGIIILPAPGSELHVQCFLRDHLVAAVPENSSFARTAVLAPEDLNGEPTVWFGRATNPHLYADFSLRCQQVGFMPRIVHEVCTVTEILDCVAAGYGIGFVPASVETRLSEKGVVFREISSPLLVCIGVAFRNDNRSDTLHLFLRALHPLSNCGDVGG
jgi:DNA-binding transcriptional LysR family regulator